MKIFLVATLALLFTNSVLGQTPDDSLSEASYNASHATPNWDSSLFKHVIKVYDVSAEDYQVYYNPDSLYIFYKSGHDGNYAYYCKTYFYPLKDTGGYSFAGTEPYVNFGSRSKFLKLISRISKLPNIKSPEIPSDKYNKKDFINLSSFLKNSKIVQIANIDSSNLVCLVHDTVTFEGYLIWNHKALERSLAFSVTDADHPPEKLSMLIAYPNKGNQVDIIINQCSLGNCESDFYILYYAD